MLTDAVVLAGSDAENVEVKPSVCSRVTTLTPRVVELIVGNVYTSVPLTVNEYDVPYDVENTNVISTADAALYAKLTVRAVVFTTAPVRDVKLPFTRNENSIDAVVDGKSSPATNPNVSCTSEPTTSLCGAGMLELTDPAAVGTQVGTICVEGMIALISKLGVPSGPRSLTFSVRSAVLEGVIDAIVTVLRSSEHVTAVMGVSTSF
jgi:hypothetical protein